MNLDHSDGCKCSACKWEREGWARRPMRSRFEKLNEMIQAGLLPPTWSMHAKDLPPLDEPDMALSLRYSWLAPTKPDPRLFIGLGEGSLPMSPPPAPPKCPPRCTPAEPCHRFGCVALAHRFDEAQVSIRMQDRELKRRDLDPTPPRPELRRIGVADLTFSRWNGRAP